MVKGYQRKMICVKQTGSEWFEEAYFLLRQDTEEPLYDEECLIREANRIVSEQRRGESRPVSHMLRQRLFWSLLGAAVAFLLCAVVLLLM